MPLLETKGAGSAQGFGLTLRQAAANYIEDVFSTWLYTGTGLARTITNGIDLSTYGGLVWIKSRSAAYNHLLTDTSRGATQTLLSNLTNAQTAIGQGVQSFGSTGFNIGNYAPLNASGQTFASWTFQKQAKFFDVVTWTGNGSNRTISHSLGSVPGCIIVKRTDTNADWQVYHRSLANTEYMVLNSTAAKATGTTHWNSTTPTSTVFSVGTDVNVNASGGTYVAYLFAHDAGGFGLAGTDNVISCGSFVGTGGNQTINLGYEPQFLILKNASADGFWFMQDNMRGFNVDGSQQLYPNREFAESNSANPKLNSTGFQHGLPSGNTGIYIAIRRGPMKTPTSGTSVYENVAYTGNATAQRQIGSSVLMDMTMISSRTGTATSWSVYAHYVYDRLRGNDVSLSTANTNVEANGWSTYFNGDVNVGWDTGSTTTQQYLNANSQTYVSHILKRAPGFMDVVCYTGTGANRTVTHNLGAVPELMIVKSRDTAVNWAVYTQATGALNWMSLNTSSASGPGISVWNGTTPTSSVFSVGTSTATNQSATNYVAYLFASCPGVSKVGSYTGNGSSQTINCGFTAGARFVMIKRTDSTGDWYVWDTARGIVAGNDPRLSLNSTAAEVTTDDSVDTNSTGFIVNQLAATNINVSSATYIYLAIA